MTFAIDDSCLYDNLKEEPHPSWRCRMFLSSTTTVKRMDQWVLLLKIGFFRPVKHKSFLGKSVPPLSVNVAENFEDAQFGSQVLFLYSFISFNTLSDDCPAPMKRVFGARGWGGVVTGKFFRPSLRGHLIDLLEATSTKRILWGPYN